MQRLPQQGDIIDNAYEIKQLLGQGGFGAVYLARQLAMDRDIALKLLVAQGPKLEEMVARFQREVMAIRNLCHPNTVRIFDFRNSESGLLYYTMEYLKGGTLKDVVARHGAFSHERATHVMRQILKSLAEAHSLGIVHRDLKPANVMIAEMHGETDFVKVLDFGIAKIIDGDTPDTEDLTSAGVLVGTLRYMSPEQIAGDQLTGASDLYSLALITIEMLTGQSVFAGSGRWEVFQQQISPDPVAIPEAVLQSPLGHILQRALEKNAKKRYQSAEEMLADISAMSQASAPEAAADEYPPNGPTQSFDLNAIDLGSQLNEDTAPEDSGPLPHVDEDEDDRTLMHDAPGITPIYGGDAATHQPEPEADERYVGAFGQAPKPTLDSSDFSGELAQPPASNTALKAAIGIVALIAVVGITFVAYSAMQGDGDPAPPDTKPDAIAVQDDDKAPSDDPESSGAATEPEAKVIAVSTGELKAQVFQDSKLLGTTPLDVAVSEVTVLRLKAEGYHDLKKILRPEDDERLELKMEPVAVATSKPEPDSTTIAARDDNKGASDATTDSKEAPSATKDSATSTRKTKPRKPLNEDDGDDPDWLAIPTGSSKKKKTPPKKKKKKKRDDSVPLFE